MTATDPTHPMSGKVALVTGASRGIGAAIAATLADAGAHVVLAARDKDSLSLLASFLSRSFSAAANDSGTASKDSSNDSTSRQHPHPAVSST